MEVNESLLGNGSMCMEPYGLLGVEKKGKDHRPPFPTDNSKCVQTTKCFPLTYSSQKRIHEQKLIPHLRIPHVIVGGGLLVARELVKVLINAKERKE
ncbi:unnamed protein product [Allacma fusca]|uniref:Uncharacterized protein n=1 Tax=Allacma fusca TaxID=39272 RepID=A0A8J2JU52_9HEXA|nr:unnamed protein product [Allacma fusca]